MVVPEGIKAVVSKVFIPEPGGNDMAFTVIFMALEWKANSSLRSVHAK
jgi:hypothetical protein